MYQFLKCFFIDPGIIPRNHKDYLAPKIETRKQTIVSKEIKIEKEIKDIDNRQELNDKVGTEKNIEEEKKSKIEKFEELKEKKNSNMSLVKFVNNEIINKNDELIEKEKNEKSDKLQEKELICFQEEIKESNTDPNRLNEIKHDPTIYNNKRVDIRKSIEECLIIKEERLIHEVT